MTGRTRNAELRGDDVLDVSPADGERLRARDGEPVRLISRYGSAVLPLRVNTAVQTGQVFATFQIPEVRLNAVTGPHRDGAVGTPEYKVTAVRIERVAT